MPELPEVEIAARNLRRWCLGRRVIESSAGSDARRIYRPSTPRAFSEAIAGARFERVERIGKQLLVTLESRGEPIGLWSHLGMTGKWVRRTPSEPAPLHARARFALDDGHAVFFKDPRMFGRLRVVPGANFGALPEVAALGPDPLERGIDPARLGAVFSSSRRAVKVLLLDQALLPGVGNILASESLFGARIDPRRAARSLSRAEVERLSSSVLAAIRATLAAEDSPEVKYLEEPGAVNPFQIYGREGATCPRCSGRIERMVQAQRSTFFCPRCQR